MFESPIVWGSVTPRERACGALWAREAAEEWRAEWEQQGGFVSDAEVAALLGEPVPLGAELELLLGHPCPPPTAAAPAAMVNGAAVNPTAGNGAAVNSDALNPAVNSGAGIGGGVDVGSLSGWVPGPGLAAVLDGLEFRVLSGHDLVETMIACQRQVACQEARLLAAVAEFARRRPAPVDVSGSDSVARFAAVVSAWAADEVGAALGLTRLAASSRLELAVALDRDLPGTRAALEAGRIDGWKARVIADETAVLDSSLLAGVEARVLGRAGGQTASLLRAACRRAVIAADPGAADARHARARAQRRVRVDPCPDGMAELRWTDSADRVLSFSTALDALARAAKQTDRGQPAASMDQLRADALAALGAALLADPRLPRTQAARPHVSVIVPLGTALGTSGPGGEEAGELTGYGPIPPALARALAADGTWTRWLTDPVSGQLLDVGRARYRPPAAIREFVLARDRTCQGTGCRVPARRCDIDHTIDWAHGGITATVNNGALCRHTHGLKDRGWTVVRDGAGLVWTTPTGHTYRREPDPIPGARPPLPLTAEHLKRVRAHARDLGIDLPSEEAPPPKVPEPQPPPYNAEDNPPPF